MLFEFYEDKLFSDISTKPTKYQQGEWITISEKSVDIDVDDILKSTDLSKIQI